MPEKDASLSEDHSFMAGQQNTLASNDPFSHSVNNELPPLDGFPADHTSKNPSLQGASYLGPGSVNPNEPHYTDHDVSEYPLSQGQRMAQNYMQKDQESEKKIEKEAHSLEMINVKLDAIRSSLDALNQRIQHLEQISSQQKNKGW